MSKKIWLITGVSSGLGKALAETVMTSGGFVIGTFRKQSQVESFNQKNKGNGFAIKLDITNLNDINEAVQLLISKFGRIEVLVNNAGIGFVGAIEESSIEEVKAVFDANFFGALQLTRSVLPFMRKEKNGHIVQISSHGGIKAFAGFGIYNASKFALEGFSEALAQEVNPIGLKVSIIEPGPFRTKFASDSLKEAKKRLSDYSETAGAFRVKLRGVDGKQEGDPVKASKAIIDIVNSDSLTLRFPLGRIALSTIAAKVESVKKDLENNRTIAEGTVFK
ncbi:SDR family NAD(P)-dependent oxidoreductase [Tamlana fucoidanivorans]|uniref:SDR family NAD(P)-dependent oxidoreductase n=1 Tax=Allotamlana fucoidanivorans TaxID=2583814 RepID=A0A5C4SK22_9FLAO|nr:oxidoreductase [Tamlana fucoidanivorans]TNJ43499.1 SDR family NAD(P)-dependent oxidoreductase [Tamlana fucoidanivorans]